MIEFSNSDFYIIHTIVAIFWSWNKKKQEYIFLTRVF